MAFVNTSKCSCLATTCELNPIWTQIEKDLQKIDSNLSLKRKEGICILATILNSSQIDLAKIKEAIGNSLAAISHSYPKLSINIAEKKSPLNDYKISLVQDIGKIAEPLLNLFIDLSLHNSASNESQGED